MEHIVVILVTIAVIIAILTLPLMWLWNWLMPTLFGLNEITVWQSLGLLLLSNILFKSSYTNLKNYENTH